MSDDPSDRNWIADAIPWVIPSLIGVQVGLTFFYGAAVVAVAEPSSGLHTHGTALLSGIGYVIGSNIFAMIASIAFALFAVSPVARRAHVATGFGLFAMSLMVISILGGAISVTAFLQ